MSHHIDDHAEEEGRDTPSPSPSPSEGSREGSHVSGMNEPMHAGNVERDMAAAQRLNNQREREALRRESEGSHELRLTGVRGRDQFGEEEDDGHAAQRMRRGHDHGEGHGYGHGHGHSTQPWP